MVRSIAHLFFHAAARHPEQVAFKQQSGEGREWTYGELADMVRETALGFSTLGIHAGDRVGLFADNSINWILSDLAVLSVGAADVPRGIDTSPAEIDYLIRHSGARVVILQDRKVLDELAPVLSDIADLQCVVLQEGSYREGDPRPVLSLDEVRERGRQRILEGAKLDSFLEGVRGEDTATIVYTSGTTGKPKGVVLTHQNILHNIRAVPAVIEFDRSDVFLSILPAWHMFERLLEYAAISKGCRTVYSSKRRFKQDLIRERPTVLAAVPRLFEMLHDEARRKLGEGSPLRRALVQTLLRTGLWYRRSQRFDPDTGRPESTFARILSPCYAAGERMVFQRFRAALGGRLRTLISGGGSLPTHVDEFFDLVGLPLLNGYGLTETAPLISVRRPQRPTLRTVGPPIPDTEVVVRGSDGAPVPPGEIGVLFVRGPQVMRGYYRDLTATRSVVGEDGFFDTGDLARVRASGDIEITGRAKDTIVLRGGENVEPEPIENVLRLSPLIEQVVVLGQDKKILGALVVPDREAVRSRLRVPVTAGGGGEDDDESSSLDTEELRTLIRAELQRLVSRENGFKPFELVRRFAIIDRPFTVDSGELTETLKIRRHAVATRHESVIDSMFAE